MSERRAIIARRLVQAARAVITFGLLILLPHERAEGKKILIDWKKNLLMKTWRLEPFFTPTLKSQDKTNALPKKAFAGSAGVGLIEAESYFRVFTKSATALASSAEGNTGFLCGAFLASSPLVSTSTI